MKPHELKADYAKKAFTLLRKMNVTANFIRANNADVAAHRFERTCKVPSVIFACYAWDFPEQTRANMPIPAGERMYVKFEAPDSPTDILMRLFGAKIFYALKLVGARPLWTGEIHHSIEIELHSTLTKDTDSTTGLEWKESL